MSIDYRQKGKVQFSMKEYIKQIFEEVPHTMNGTAKTLVANYLSNLNDRAIKLPHEKAECKTTIFLQKNMPGYTSHCSIPMFKVKKSR